MAVAQATTGRFNALDGWRGVCACMVALSHLPITDHLHRSPWVWSASFYVDFFFVLSGFVIASGYAERIGDWSSFGAFVARRFARLWPLHAAVTAVSLLFLIVYLHFTKMRGLTPFIAAPSGGAAAALASNLAMLQGLAPPRLVELNQPSWSISDEFYTYLLCGAVCLAAARLQRRSLRLGLAVALSLLGVAVLARFSRFGMQESGTWSVFRCLYAFFVGFLAWHAWRARWWGRIGGSAAELVIVALVVLFIWRAAGSRLAYASPALFAAAVAVFANERGVVSRVLVSRPFLALGAWSYSIYLVHMVLVKVLCAAAQVAAVRSHVLGFVVRDMPFDMAKHIVVPAPVGDVVSLLYLVAVCAVAAVTYRWIELPGQRLFRARWAVEPAIAAP